MDVENISIKYKLLLYSESCGWIFYSLSDYHSLAIPWLDKEGNLILPAHSVCCVTGDTGAQTATLYIPDP